MVAAPLALDPGPGGSRRASGVHPQARPGPCSRSCTLGCRGGRSRAAARPWPLIAEPAAAVMR